MTTEIAPDRGDQARPPLRVLRRIIIIAVILAIGFVAAGYMIKTRPRIHKRPPEQRAPLVTVASLQPDSTVVRITAMGTVVPSREIMLKTPVGGEIVSLDADFTAGGLLAKGERILQIDPRDYELALIQRERALADAEYAAKLEEGRQDVARREWELLYGKDGEATTESDLALRRPHLEKVRSDIKAASAELELARLNLSRATVTAPFNAMVLNKYVDSGAFVAPQEKLANLVATDAYWVQVSLPLDRLQWVTIPRAGVGNGSAARIYYRKKFERKGRVIRLLGDLGKVGRMARLLVTVPDPLGLSSPDQGGQPLILGEYVRVEIEGKTLAGVYRIPRTALHNNREIWIATEDGRLSIRPVETVWRDETDVLVRDNIKSGDQLIISGLATPVDGMAVRIDQGDQAREKMPQPEAEASGR